LFDRLGASDEQLDFPVVYTSALEGYATADPTIRGADMTPLFETIVSHVAPPDVDPDGPFQMQVSALDYSSFVGLIGIGRISRGSIKTNTVIKVIDREGYVRDGRMLQIMGFHGLERIEVAQAQAGDIIAFTGLDELYISDTLCDPGRVEPLPPLTVDEPTMSVMFQVNASPFAGRDGRHITSRKLDGRLHEEQLHNVALRVELTDDPDRLKVSGRGELHLSILIETMRREGYELAVSRPEVVLRDLNGKTEEPYEIATIEVEEAHQGSIMESLGTRRGQLLDMLPAGKGRVRLDYLIPSRGLIGFQTEFLTLTSGTGTLHHVFERFGPHGGGPIGRRKNGVMVSNTGGKALGYALFNLQERGRLFIGPGEEVYEGMIVGIHSRGNDIVVNPTRAKQLTNIRAAARDENILLSPPVKLTLEQALEFIEDDELVEVTPSNVRLRKKHLREHERRRAARANQKRESS
jgi:GTP-binding protein